MATITIKVPDETRDMMNAVIMANHHKSKSDIVRRGIEMYIDSLPDELKRRAKGILNYRYLDPTCRPENGE